MMSFISESTNVDSEGSPSPQLNPQKHAPSIVFSSNEFDLPSRCGWLQKKSPKFLIGWQWRYFELKDKKLYYFKSTVGRKPKGVINFDLVFVEMVDVANSNEFTLVPLGSKRRFFIKAESPQVKHEWLQDLTDHLLMAAGRENTSLVSSAEWWRTDRISMMQFIASAYKAMQIMHPDVASVSVLPGKFSYEGDLQLIGSSFLGEEQLIDFNIPH
jgi:hypothetical protein